MRTEDLAEYGANVEEGLARCMGKDDFYIKLVDAVRNDPSFEKLPVAVGEGRLKDAFEIAHALKGSLGNLSLDPLYVPMCEITELLRAETKTDYGPLLEKIASEHARLCAIA